MKVLLLLLSISLVCHSLPISTPQATLNPNQVAPSSTQAEELASFMEVKDKSAQDVNDYFPVDPSEASTDPKIQDALTFGIQTVIANALQEQKISVVELTVTEVRGIKRQTTGSGVNYNFAVTLDNGQGTTVWASFTVFVRDFDQSRSVLSYDYEVQAPVVQTRIEPIEQNYTVVEANLATQDALIQANLQYGLEQLLQKVKTEGKVSPVFSTADVTRTEEQTVNENYTFYRFNVELTNADTNLTATFTVLYNEETTESKIWSLLYKAVPLVPTGIVQADPEGYVKIETFDVQNDPVIRKNLQYGVSKVIAQALQDQKVPLAVYPVTQIKSAGQQSIGEITYYRFNVVLSNAAKATTIEANFTVKYDTVKVTRELTEFGYNATTTTASSA